MTQTSTGTAAVSGKVAKLQGVRPCLTFKDQAEAAITFYVSLFENSKILSVVRSESNSPIPKGKLLHASFQLDGQEYTAFDGGESFSFTEAFSFVVTCDTQDAIDEMWTRLSDGGEEGPCGWLKDRFGLSWQVVPTALGEMMSNPSKGNPAKLMEALLKMGKLDLATLERAYRSS